MQGFKRKLRFYLFLALATTVFGWLLYLVMYIKIRVL